MKGKEPYPQFVTSQGYVALFPLLFGLLDARNPKLERVLLDLRNTSHLWSDFGLRSLGRSTRRTTRNATGPIGAAPCGSTSTTSRSAPSDDTPVSTLTSPRVHNL